MDGVNIALTSMFAPELFVMLRVWKNYLKWWKTPQNLKVGAIVEVAVRALKA